MFFMGWHIKDAPFHIDSYPEAVSKTLTTAESSHLYSLSVNIFNTVLMFLGLI